MIEIYEHAMRLMAREIIEWKNHIAERDRGTYRSIEITNKEIESLCRYFLDKAQEKA